MNGSKQELSVFVVLLQHLSQHGLSSISQQQLGESGSSTQHICAVTNVTVAQQQQLHELSSGLRTDSRGLKALWSPRQWGVTTFTHLVGYIFSS